MIEYCEKLQIRINYIPHLKSEFIKYVICKKFYIYGKIMYIMRTVKYYSEWRDKHQKIHNFLENQALNGVLFVQTRSSQVPLSRSSGGLGLRSPQLFEPAAKIIKTLKIHACHLDLTKREREPATLALHHLGSSHNEI